MKKIQVSYLGLNSLFGRVTTNLLKQSPCIEKLSLYDDDETSLLEDGANVFIGREQLPDAVKDVNIVVIGDEPCECQEEERLKIIGPKIIRYTEAILKSSPNAIIVVAASPLNTLVPLVGHFLGPEWQHRLLGITSVDTLRASRLLNRFLENPLGPTHVLPVVGGSSNSSRVPLFSHLHPKIVVCKDIREKILEKMKLFDNSKCQELDSVERAYSAVRFIHSVISGMLKDSPIPEIAMTKTAVVPSAEFLSLPMLIGKNGIENALPLPKFDEAEEELFLQATERLADDSRRARDFINSLAQESVRNSKTISNASITKSLTWNKDKHQNLLKQSELRVKDVQETATAAEMVSTQCKSSKLNTFGLRLNEARNVKSGSRNSDENKLAQTSSGTSTGESRSFTYRLLNSSGSNDESQEMQSPSRKPIPKCPTYQLIPESRGINRDARKVIGDDKAKVSVDNKTAKPSENSITSLKSAEDTSSKGSTLWQSPTRTALETSSRTGPFKDHNVPRPSNIQHLPPEVVPLEPVPKTNFNAEKVDKMIEGRPSLTESDVSGNEAMETEYTEILLEEVSSNLGALNKYAGTEDSKNKIACGKSKSCEVNDVITTSKTVESDNKQTVDSESIKQDVSPNNDEVTSNSSIQNHSERVVDVQLVNESKQMAERDANLSFSNQKVFRTVVAPSCESAPEFLNRKRMISAKKCDSGEKSLGTDSEVVGGKRQNTGPSTRDSGPVDDINTTPKSRESSSFSIFKKNNVDASGKRWKKKLSDENKWAPSMGGTAFDNCKKNVSKESSGSSVYGKRKSQPVGNEEFPNKNSKDRYPIGFPGNSKKSGVAKTIAGEERILCLSNGRIENSFNTNSLRDSKTNSDLKKLSNKETLKPGTPSSKSPNTTAKDVGKSEMMLRSKFRAATSHSNKGLLNRGVSFPSGANSGGKIVEDVGRSKNGDDKVSSNLPAARSRETHNCGLIKDIASDTPLKLLNLPGCRHRYEANPKLLEFNEQQKDVDADGGDFASAGTQKNLTADSIKGYYEQQRIGSSLCNRNTRNSALNLESPIKKRSKKRGSKQKETRTQKLKSSKKRISQVANVNKKVVKDHQKANWKHSTQVGKQSTQVGNQCGTVKKTEQHTVPKKTVSKNLIDRKKSELAGVTKKISDTVKEDEWESKYFTKASEMFFRMFRDSVADNTISGDRNQTKTNVVRKEGIDTKKLQEAKSSLPRASSTIQPSLINTKDAPGSDEGVRLNRIHPSNKSIEVNNSGDSTKLNVIAEKSEKWLASTISEIKKAKTLQVGINNGRNLKTKQKLSNGAASVKVTEGSNLNKLKMLQPSDSRAETETSTEEKRGADSIFNTKITGMEKYQLEKNDNVKKEISLNSSIDVEKLFEESSTIPLHGSSARKKRQPTNIVGEKGTKPSSSNNRSILQGINATSDKGRGDSVNMIDFSIYKSPLFSDQASPRNDVGLSREMSSSNFQTSTLCPVSKPSSSIRNDISWRSSAAGIPISSKNIKQVNPQNYKEQILNSCMKKVEDGIITKGEKTNKWERILSIFKQIIVRDLEEERPESVLARSIKKLPVQPRETESNISYPQVKPPTGGNRALNNKTVKGKVSSKVKKKTGIVKKKLPSETIRRNKVIKNNPKKIVNYFSKRGNAGSADEKCSVSNLDGNSFEQTPTSYNGHAVIVGKHNKKPAMKSPLK